MTKLTSWFASRVASGSRSDEGASLLIVLVVVGVLGVLMASLSSFGATAELLTLQLNDQAKTTYSAGSGLDAAINAASRNPLWGVDTGSGDCKATPGPFLTLPSSTSGVNNLGVNVSCRPWTNSGHVTPGNGVGDNNSPRYAVLTLPLGGDPHGIRQNSNNDLRVNGKVFSGGDISMGGAGATLTATDDLKAHGPCDAGVTVVAPATKTCNVAAVPTDPQNDSDSAYAATWQMPSVDPTLAATSVPTTCPATNIRVMSPGRYTDAASLSALTGGGCNNGIVYFQPGNYYFDFNNNSDVWTVNQPSTSIVGGLVAGWTPAAGVGAYDSTLACAGNDVNQLADSGVAFVFAGDSRMSFNADKSIQLCAQPSSTHQEIAIWGVKTSTSVPPQTLTDQKYYATDATSPSAGNTTTFGTPKPNATGTPDGTTSDASLTSTTSATATATLHATTFNATDIPSNATITAVRARIVHKETGSNPDLNKLTLKVVSGGSTVDISSSASTSMQTTPAPLAVSDFDTPDKRSAASVDVSASEATANGSSGSTRSVTVKIDAVQLSFDYTIPAVAGLTGEAGTCITAATPCPLISSSGSNATNIFIHGTIYAPLAALDLQLTNQAGQLIQRGVVARTITANITASSSFTGALFGLPDKVLVTIVTPRKMTFTASIGSGQAATAVVQFDDATVPAGVQILSWNVRHCGSTGC